MIPLVPILAVTAGLLALALSGGGEEESYGGDRELRDRAKRLGLETNALSALETSLGGRALTSSTSPTGRRCIDIETASPDGPLTIRVETDSSNRLPQITATPDGPAFRYATGPALVETTEGGLVLVRASENFGARTGRASGPGRPGRDRRDRGGERGKDGKKKEDKEKKEEKEEKGLDPIDAWILSDMIADDVTRTIVEPPEIEDDDEGDGDEE